LLLRGWTDDTMAPGLGIFITVASMTHLARRFAGSVWPGGPTTAERHWAEGHLIDAERELFALMSGPDRRHAIGVAHEAERLLGSDASRPVMAAALLHDVGKLDSRLGTYGRVVATLCAKIAGRDMAASWASGTGFTRRVGLYLQHDELGATRLEMAGSDPFTVAWTREHHRARETWSVELPLADALKLADGD
jgi:hypothetical protein